VLAQSLRTGIADRKRYCFNVVDSIPWIFPHFAKVKFATHKRLQENLDASRFQSDNSLVWPNHSNYVRPIIKGALYDPANNALAGLPIGPQHVKCLEKNAPSLIFLSIEREKSDVCVTIYTYSMTK
jgi:hypothetical protein